MSFKQISTQDKNTQLIQDNIAAALLPLQNTPMVNGVLLSGVILKAGQDNLISHTLNRKPAIFFVGNLDQNTAVWAQTSASISNQKWNSSVINLRCSSDCTISLWIN